jgi:glycogen debranching enzyme
MHELPTSVDLLGLNKWKSDFPYYLAAADSTPLYIVALKNYIDASGDVEFLNEIWRSVEKAFRWLITTDYDGDGLIDNFEGHGWVEGGPLAYNQIAKGHTTLYLAGVYLQCLKDMVSMARLLNKHELEETAQRLIPNAQSALEAYWNLKGYYNDRKLAIGGYGTEKTIAPSVPILFGACTQERAISNLKIMNDPKILTPWGARYIASDEPAYDPTLSHAGTVWPLFTGWLTLANYKMRLANEGFAAFMTNVQHTYTNALGFVGEAYRGDRFVEVGTPHQGWSETAVTQGFMEGLLGLKLNAISKEATLNPLLPESIDEVRLSNLRVGTGELNIQLTRRNDGTYSLLDRSFGVRVRLEQP